MPRNKQEAGFTLIEAMIAAVVLLVAIVFVAQIFVTAMQQNKTSRQFTHATAIAQSKIEELNALPIEQLRYGGQVGKKSEDGDKDGEPGFMDFVSVDNASNDAVGVVTERSKANYARYWKIEPDPQGWAGMYRITVRVISLRPGPGDRREEVTLSTVRSQF